MNQLIAFATVDNIDKGTRIYKHCEVDDARGIIDFRYEKKIRDVDIVGTN